MKYIYLLKEVDLDKRIGTLGVRPEYPINSKWAIINVELSRYLLGAIKLGNRGLKKGDNFVGTKFKSTIDSYSFKENPFRLICFKPDEGSDIPEHYKLELVTEAAPIVIQRTMFDGSTYLEYTNRLLKPKYYRRYSVSLNKLKLSELKAKILMVDSNFRLVDNLDF